MAQFLAAAPLIAASATPAIGGAGIAAATAAAAGPVFGAGLAGGSLFAGIGFSEIFQGISLLSTIAGAASEGQAAELAALDIKQRAELESIKAGEQALERRERLLRALAAQSARVGASGVSGVQGSPLQVKLEDIKEFEKEDIRKQKLDDIRRKQAGISVSRTRTAGRFGAGVSLITGLGETFETFSKLKKS